MTAVICGGGCGAEKSALRLVAGLFAVWRPASFLGSMNDLGELRLETITESLVSVVKR